MVGAALSRKIRGGSMFGVPKAFERAPVRYCQTYLTRVIQKTELGGGIFMEIPIYNNIIII